MFTMPITATEQLVADRRHAYTAAAARRRLRDLIHARRATPAVAPVAPITFPERRPASTDTCAVRTVA